MTLLPELGGAIARLDEGDAPVLRATRGLADVVDAASFPMVPYANRVAMGRFFANGRMHQLPLNFGDHPHSLHGVGWKSEWQVAARSLDQAILIHDHCGSGGWPWQYHAEQRFSLTESGLVAELAVTNGDIEPMPVGLGFHPYFACGPTTRLRFAAAGLWRTGETLLPTESAPPDTMGDWESGAAIPGNTLIDNAYFGWQGTASIEHGDGRGYQLSACGASWLHLYRQPDAKFFCAEPVSHGPDAINREGMPMLAPGSTQLLEMRVERGKRRGNPSIPGGNGRAQASWCH